MRRAAILLAYFFICVNCSSQIQQFNAAYNFKHLNVQNGLVQNIVYHFLHDSRGYMWIGTHNGVTLYDGNRTINFLHDPKVSSSISMPGSTRRISPSARITQRSITFCNSRMLPGQEYCCIAQSDRFSIWLIFLPVRAANRATK